MSAVVVVDPGLTRELRRAVLRPHLTADDVLPGDDRPDAVHLADLAGDGRPLCASFVFPQPCPWLPGRTAWQLRQMATAPAARGSGHGRAVVAAAEAYAREQGAAVLWCYARESAAGFYERCGWQRHGEVFTDADHPTAHQRMWISCR
ncbi:MAG: GNAT family N-acetyltransferase [Jatrophihabitans sp.]|nr:MAG: GNAT family N-acetyltransferase [Jatrophihabitans sp.]